MKAIVRRSVLAVTFVSLLGLSLTAPQLRHVERFADLIVVAPRRKTLAQLASLEVEGVDPSNLADFFRISPWKPDDLRLPLARFTLRYLLSRCRGSNLSIFFSIDDSIAPKDKDTKKLESVDWLFDHTRNKTVRGGNHVVLRIHWGDFHFPLSWRLYLREKTVRRLNRRRKNNKLRYRSKLELAKEMLQQAQEMLQEVLRSLPDAPKEPSVYVLFDTWYTSAKLVTWIRRQEWHVIAGVKSNRKLSKQKLTDWHKQLKGRPYERVSLGLANGTNRTYCVRSVQGRLSDVPGEVRVLISQKGPGARAPKYFLCTDTKLSAQEILSRYQLRWSQEVDYWHVKLQLGLADFRVQSYEAIEKWYAVVYLVLVYLHWRRYEQQKETGRATGVSEVITKIREEHQEAVLRAACQEVADGASVAEVVAKYLGKPTTTAA
jgi:hypothetical protein